MLLFRAIPRMDLRLTFGSESVRSSTPPLAEGSSHSDSIEVAKHFNLTGMVRSACMTRDRKQICTAMTVLSLVSAQLNIFVSADLSLSLSPPPSLLASILHSKSHPMLSFSVLCWALFLSYAPLRALAQVCGYAYPEISVKDGYGVYQVGYSYQSIFVDFPVGNTETSLLFKTRADDRCNGFSFHVRFYGYPTANSVVDCGTFGCVVFSVSSTQF